jgi:hypothetical protein
MGISRWHIALWTSDTATKTSRIGWYEFTTVFSDVLELSFRTRKAQGCRPKAARSRAGPI